jgi:hypothetical protein
MPFSITGAKYALQTLTAVGTNTVTINGATPFVVADFTVIQRIAALYTSDSVFKGIAYVRRATSTTVLELETAFFDPIDGSTITQVIGDRLLISKNFVECVTAGLAVTGNRVAITDVMTLGTSGVSTSLCLYDEFKTISITTGSPAITHAGGCVVLGHLQDFATSSVYGGCTIGIEAAPGIGIAPISAAANWMMYGGAVTSTTNHPSGGFTGVANTPANTQLYCGATLAVDMIGNNPNGSGNFTSNSGRQALVNCDTVVRGNNGIGVRWGSGIVRGGSVKVVGSGSISAFGSSPGTFNIGAPSGQLLTVADIRPGVSFGGSGPATALWDAPGAGAVINWTNVVTPQRTLGRIASTTFNWYWKNTYSNLQTGTRAVIERSVDRGVAASAVAAASSAELTILEQTQVGATRTPATTVDYSAWTYGLWKYGYAPISGTFNRTTYSLGTAGNSNYVSFGGAQLQAVDENITASEATALAYTELDTLDKLYDRAMAWKCESDANAQYPTLSVQLATGSGTVLDFGSINIVIDGTAASAFAVNTETNTITIKSTTLQKGTKFSAIKTTGTVILGTASGAMSNLTVNGNVTQATPTNLSNVVITGTLTYNTNSNVTITITNTTINTVVNNGTGIVTITPTNSTITTYTDAQINYLDSNITFSGVDSITFYPTSGDANTGTNAGATITTSPYNFKYGSVISGVTMIGTLNIRYSIGGKVTIGTLTIALGSNSFVLTDNELLGSINASVALTAKEDTVQKIKQNTDLIPATL